MITWWWAREERGARQRHMKLEGRERDGETEGGGRSEEKNERGGV